MSELKWLPEALADIKRLYAFLYDKNPQAAMRAAKAILEGANFLVTVPDIGRPMNDDTGRREWFISFGAGAYVLRYMREGDAAIVIIRVWYNRQDHIW